MNKKQSLILMIFLILITIASSACDQGASAKEVSGFGSAPATQEAAAINPATIAAAPGPTLNPAQTLDPSQVILLPYLPGPEASCVPAGTEQVVATVTKVIDGDDILVDIQGKSFDIRYNGIDTPDSDGEYFGEQALAKNRELVEGKTVVLIKDGVEADEWGRLERYVFVGRHFINLELVANGYAFSMETRPGLACREAFMTAERAAELHSLGMWAGIQKSTLTPYP